LENVLINDDGYLVLTDFGITKHLKVDEKTFTVCGSPEYMSPEMIKGKGYNKMTDWWSFGVLVYLYI
jgi:protein kinase X